jgi:hypothetical protein
MNEYEKILKAIHELERRIFFYAFMGVWIIVFYDILKHLFWFK